MQVALSSTSLAAYRAWGTAYRVGPTALSVIGSGDAHETYELEPIPEPVTYWITYFAPATLAAVATEVFARRGAEVGLAVGLVQDQRLLTLMARFHRSLADGTMLERDDTLLAVVQDLVRRFGRDRRGARDFRSWPRAVAIARDYLRDNVRRDGHSDGVRAHGGARRQAARRGPCRGRAHRARHRGDTTCAPNGLDAVLALAGGEELEGCLDLLRSGGRIAYPNGIEPEPARRRSITVRPFDAEADPRYFTALRRFLEGGGIQIPIAATYPLTQAARAHRRLAKGGIVGRIVLRIPRS